MHFSLLWSLLSVSSISAILYHCQESSGSTFIFLWHPGVLAPGSNISPVLIKWECPWEDCKGIITYKILTGTQKPFGNCIYLTVVEYGHSRKSWKVGRLLPGKFRYLEGNITYFCTWKRERDCRNLTTFPRNKHFIHPWSMEWGISSQSDKSLGTLKQGLKALIAIACTAGHTVSN